MLSAHHGNHSTAVFLPQTSGSIKHTVKCSAVDKNKKKQLCTSDSETDVELSFGTHRKMESGY